MTFVVSGNFNHSQIKPLLERWLAGIPEKTQSSNATQWRDNHITPINSSLRYNFPYGTSDKAMVSIIYSADANWDHSDQLALSLLDTIANLRLRTIIREQHSGVYTIIFSQQLLKRPTSYYLARLNFTTDPKRVDEITELVNNTMNSIKKHGITSNELIQAKQAWKVNNKDLQKSAQYWSSAIAQTATDDQNFAQLVNQEKIINSITLEQVNLLAKQFIGKNLKEFRLEPIKMD